MQLLPDDVAGQAGWGCAARGAAAAGAAVCRAAPPMDLLLGLAATRQRSPAAQLGGVVLGGLGLAASCLWSVCANRCADTERTGAQAHRKLAEVQEEEQAPQPTLHVPAATAGEPGPDLPRPCPEKDRCDAEF